MLDNTGMDTEMKPKTVKIGGHHYRIKWKKNLARREDAAGRSCASNLAIHLDPDGSKSHIDEVFWHEVIEQINYLYELNLPHAQISILGAAFFQVLSDNPKIVKEFS
jgi:hypothetical protein